MLTRESVQLDGHRSEQMTMWTTVSAKMSTWRTNIVKQANAPQHQSTLRNTESHRMMALGRGWFTPVLQMMSLRWISTNLMESRQIEMKILMAS